jgi:hypothetical protein
MRFAEGVGILLHIKGSHICACALARQDMLRVFARPVRPYDSFDCTPCLDDSLYFCSEVVTKWAGDKLKGAGSVFSIT